MLRFNTFRAKRYLRSKFVEGKYLLASEAGDIELEILDVLRDVVKQTIGDVALADAWKVEKLSDTELLIKPGEAWFKGLPFQMRSGKDQLVSGAVLSAGVMPVGVSISDDATGLGKVLLFNDAALTPTNNYRIVISAREELLTEVQDPFLQNANLTESTAQKIRLRFQINLVPESLQTETPIPYRDESSTSLVATNFPIAGAFAAPNLVNQIVVTPTAAGNGELVGTQLITGSEKIDGRDIELTLRNDSAIGGGHPIPKSPTEQVAFENGKLIDSNGNKYHINAIFNDVVSTQVVLRLDKEPDQPNPEIVNTKPFTLIKRDVYATDGINGQPQGKLFWNIATVDWHSSNLIVHESKIVDLRTSVSNLKDYEVFINNKHGLRLTEGGDISWDLTTEMLDWSAALTLVNPHGSDMTIALASVPLVEGGSLAYDLNLSGGAIQKGTLAINVTAFGANSTLSAAALDQVKVGNIVVDSAGVAAEITAIDDIANVISTSPSLTANGAATIYYDSFGPGKVPLTKEKYILAVRKNNKIILSGLELEDGETSQVGDGASAQLLTFIGSTGDSDDAPDYPSNFYVIDGDSLVTAIGTLDAALDALNLVVGAISWKAPVANLAALPVLGNVDGDVRLTLDTRVAYTWHSSTTSWKPVNGTGGGVKIIGGGTVDWSLGSPTPTPFSITQTSVPTEDNVNVVNNWRGQTFTTSAISQVSTAGFYFKRFGAALAGNIVYKLYATSAGLPTTLLDTSNPLDSSIITGTTTLFNLTFSSLPYLSASTMYAIVADFSAVTFNSTLGIGISLADPYASGTQVTSANSGASWTLNSANDFGFNIQGDTFASLPTNEISFDANMFLEIKGLSYSDNTIPISESPIVLASSLDVAYVIPNLTTGGPNLVVTVDTLDQVPANALIIARRDGADAIVGSSSTRLASGQSTKLYAQTSDQTLSYIGSPDTADSTPSYSSDIRGTAAESLTARTGSLTDSMGDSQEDRSMYLRSDDPVTWTGTQLQFTTDIVVEVVNTKSGTLTQHTILLAGSPIVLANNESAWVTIDRTLASENLTVNLSGTTPIPAQSQANKDVIVIARRKDAVGAGYVHIPLHKQVLEPGQTVRLGASGSGDGGGNEILESLKNHLLDSFYELTTPNIFKVDKATKVDGSSTGAYNLVDKTFTMAAGQTLVSTQMLDAGEFLANDTTLSEVELLVYWKLSDLNTLATYEVSRNGLSSFQTIDMERIGTTDLYRGIKTFDTETNASLASNATGASTVELNASTQQQLSQKVILASKTMVRSVDLTVTKTGSPAGYLFVSIIKDDGADKPSLLSSDVLSESVPVTMASISTGTLTVALPEATLAPGSYHIVLRTLGYTSTFVTNVTSLKWDSEAAASAPFLTTYDGSVWTVSTEKAKFDLEGITLDLRVRVTSVTNAGKLEGYGILYDKTLSGKVADGQINVEVFEFDGSLDTTEFTLTKFTPHPDLLKVYDVNSGQVYTYGAFGLDGHKVIFEAGQFLNPSETIKLRFIQIDGTVFDNSDVNGLLLASNFLGSTDASIDRSQPGRGIFLRRPDGTLREITIDDSDSIVVYSV